MALKLKGKAAKQHMPKAGPKKCRAKSEEEQIRAAVDEHGRRSKTARRKATKVNRYTYKETDNAKRKRADAFVRAQEMQFQLREPGMMSEYEKFRESLSPDQRVFSTMYWHMTCEHDDEVLTQTGSYVEGVEPEHVRCKRCHLVRRWMGTKTATKQQEWAGYCPDGYDMFDWLDLYMKDRSMWRFIHDECQAEMVEGVIA